MGNEVEGWGEGVYFRVFASSREKLPTGLLFIFLTQRREAAKRRKRRKRGKEMEGGGDKGPPNLPGIPLVGC